MSRYAALMAVFLAALGLGQPAHAYLDPGTGSMFLQLLLGGIAGGLMVVRLYWARVRQFFAGKKPGNEKPADK